ncbi:apolipoprotein N-acyltransferase [Sphingomonas xanthus]|uniref:Apolipoprotein N-acyltransferase n=2 Tax=Sphingomonas xanthus TaxID=2594473 RepID=A0A516IUJ1_9SPHN|nr:apolipoprotein N-acyltransferase [Sphingomonas xanthus]
MSRIPHSLAALGAGLVSALAFEPVGWWPLMLLAVALLCESIARSASLWRALLVGWAFGVGQFLIGLNWIATAFTFQAAMPAWLGWIAVLLLSLYLAIYPAMAAGLAWRFGRTNRTALVLALAGGWAITEWLRATMFTGFAWNPIGVALVDTPLLGASRWIGTYGLSGLTAMIGASLWLLARKQWHVPAITAAAAVVVWALPAPAPVAPASLPPSDAPSPGGSEVSGAGVPIRSIRIVQPNIGQQDKWREGFEDEAYRRLERLTMKGAPEPRLVFWPEAAVTEPLSDERRGAERIVFEERLRATRTLGAADLLVTGGIGLSSTNRRHVDGATNSVFVMKPLGELVGRYDKAHLVPYGEYLPMRPILSAIGLSRLAPGDLDFNPGPGAQSMQLPGDWGKVGFQLCYEIIFSGEVVDRADRPDFIFNPSNDAWFGRWGPPQHLAQARLRAAEEGLPVIRSTPTGISALVDGHGRLRNAIPWQQAGFIDAALPAPLGPTLFARAGNLVPLALGFLMLIAAIALGRRRRYRLI